MGAPSAQVARRAVFDTSVVVSALLFRDGQLVWMRDAWRAGTIVPLVSPPTARELVRVLAYPKFELEPAEREELLGDYLPHAEVFDKQYRGAALPKCRDPDDQMFLQLAAAASADALVTGDADLLALAGRLPFPVLTPRQMRERVKL